VPEACSRYRTFGVIMQYATAEEEGEFEEEEEEERVREEQERRTAEQEAHHHANNGESLSPQDIRVRLWSAYARQDSRRAVQQLDEVHNYWLCLVVRLPVCVLLRAAVCLLLRAHANSSRRPASANTMYILYSMSVLLPMLPCWQIRKSCSRSRS
jgi:VIT1/CCC1 family predicted Fe2+/Mn2+ transporter